MKLMVLDGNSIVNRAYYGIRPLTTRQGLYTNAIYGFITTLQRLLDEEKPEALCVTFDRREPTFRHEADAAYKAQRKGMPEELAMQMLPLKQVLTAMSIPRYELTGYEADDLIGTISRKCEAAGWDCVIVTGDKDSLQLITDHTKVKLVSTRMGQTTTKDMTPETFQETYGFAPIHMIDLKALMGDSSDNIPGVPGIGEKTAMALVQEYGSIDTLYAQMPDVHAKPAALRKLQEGEESARHSYWLATIVTDAPLEFRPEDTLRQPVKPELSALFLRLAGAAAGGPGARRQVRAVPSAPARGEGGRCRRGGDPGDGGAGAGAAGPVAGRGPCYRLRSAGLQRTGGGLLDGRGHRPDGGAVREPVRRKLARPAGGSVRRRRQKGGAQR